MYVASLEADFHAGIPQLSGDVIDVPGGHHDSDVNTADSPRTCPEVGLQHNASIAYVLQLFTDLSSTHGVLEREAQLSQIGRATLSVVGNFTKSLKAIRNHH